MAHVTFTNHRTINVHSACNRGIDKGVVVNHEPAFSVKPV